jgi:hypothetical protein
MKKVICTLACILLLQISPYAFSIEPDETGLKTGGDLRVPVIILGLQQPEADDDLEEPTTLREVELRLLRYGIIPADREAAHELGWYLGIDILIVGSAYHVKVGFHRRVAYDVGDRKYGKEGVTWQSWYTGVHDGDSEIIIDSLLDCLDDFGTEFLEANTE